MMTLKKYDLPKWLHYFNQKPNYPKEWPNGAHIAIVVHVAFEVWSERPMTAKAPEAAFGRGSSGPLPAEAEGKYDTMTILEHDYAGRVGVWRMLDLLGKYNIRGTFLMSGSAVDRYPDAAREIFSRGHEVASRHYYQDVLPPLFTENEEKAHIQKTTEALMSLGFDREKQGPVGFLGSIGRFTEYTEKILVQEGYIWHCGYMNDERPYCIKVPVDGGYKPLVIIPINIRNAVQDFSLYGNSRCNTPSELFEFFRDEFEILYEEGKNGRPAIVNCICHPFVGGRPYVVKWWEQMIKYALGFKNVWFATRMEIARWMLEKYPPY